MVTENVCFHSAAVVAVEAVEDLYCQSGVEAVVAAVAVMRKHVYFHLAAAAARKQDFCRVVEVVVVGEEEERAARMVACY
uniref:Uncharacterized protein n=1 Tax=Arundo donax TaxID=35708 RepID=A0A0A9CJN3_ARUDO